MVHVCYLFVLIISLAVPIFAQNTDAALSALQNYRTGRSQESAGNMADANRYYNEAVRICMDEINRNNGSSESYTVLTWSLQRQKKYTEVISWGERGLNYYADEYRLFEIMGEAYFYLDNYSKSLQYMQHYIGAFPQGDSVATAYFFMGDILRLQGKYNSADIAYTTALQLNPGVALWWYRLGVAREAAGDYANAVTAYERALRINPNYSEARAGAERSRQKAG
jgi:tetratricopeptide (TPR) repeat protein